MSVGVLVSALSVALAIAPLQVALHHRYPLLAWLVIIESSTLKATQHWPTLTGRNDELYLCTIGHINENKYRYC